MGKPPATAGGFLIFRWSYFRRMIPVLSAEQARRVDAHTIEHMPIASVDLMERAARACTDWLLGHVPPAQRAFLVLVGCGNNGGDGMAIARMLAATGARVRVVLCHYRDTLSEEQIDSMAEQLNVKRHEVTEMETRLAGGDVLLDPSPSDDGEHAFGPIAYLTDTAHEPTAMIESRQRDVMATDGIASALAALDDRSRRIVEERWLKVNDDSSGGMTLHDLADEYGVSAERIRQIEVAAMKKMKKSLAAYA